VILTSLQVLSNAVGAALKDTEGNLTQTSTLSTLDHYGTTTSPRRNQSFVGAPSGFGNVLHVALVGINNPMSAFQDRWVCHSLEHVLVPVCLGVKQFLRLLFVVSSSTVVHM
jgi:hypothetical protein